MIDTNEAIVGTLLSFLATAILYLNNRGKFNAQSVRQDEVITDFAVSFKNELDVARKEADAARARHNEQLAFRDAIIQQERDTANAERADWKKQTEQWAQERANWKLQTEQWAEERGHWAEEREAREAALGAVRIQLTESNAQLTESNALVTQYKAENQALLTSVDGMRQELVVINQERTSERTSLQSQLETANKRVNDLEEQIRLDNEKFSNSLNGLMAEITGLQTDNTDLKKALAEAGQEKSDDRVTHLQEQVASLESHRKEAASTAGDKAEIAGLKAEIRELKHPTTEAPTVANGATPATTDPLTGNIVGTIPVYSTGPLAVEPAPTESDDESL